MQDINGRKYLKLTDGIFFKCADGQHYISGQADDGIYCIGIYP